MKCPMTTRQIVDEYFMENRHRLLDIAAFLDRLERSADGEDADTDFRIRAFRDALQLLVERQPERARRALMIFTDPTIEPRPALDRKAAYGAYCAPAEPLAGRQGASGAAVSSPEPASRSNRVLGEVK